MENESKVEEYAWNFIKDSMDYKPCYSIDECLKEARNARKYEEEYPETVYIGGITWFEPSLDGRRVLEILEDFARKFGGEIGGDRESCNPKKDGELDELSKGFASIVCEWLKKYGYCTGFFTVGNIKEYEI